MLKLDAALPLVSLQQVPAIARAAEALGFAGLWSTETQHDPFLPHPLIAEHTARLEMGTAIAVSFARSPATLAYTAWDLAAQSQGRFILGLGTQVKAHIERRFGMDWPESVTGKLREQIQVIRAFWQTWQTGAPLQFRGEHYKITLMAPFFNPGPLPFFEQTQANELIPIYIAGVNTGLARLAGELCDGFLVHPFHSPRYLKEIIRPAIQLGLEKENRSWERLKVAVTAFAATNPVELESCRQQLSFYASTPSYRPVMELHGWGAASEKLSSLAARGKWAEMPGQISDEMLAEFVTQAADARELGQALHQRYGGLANRISLYLPFVPGERDEFWKELLASGFTKAAEG